jgi:hypothetical protein
MASLTAWASSECGAGTRFASADPAALSSSAGKILDAITLVLSTDGILDGDISVVLPIAQELAMSYIGVTVPWIAFAVIVILCGLPLCIARCCAHKCCRPALDPDSDVLKTLPTKRLKVTSVACLATLGLGAIVCAVIGLLAVMDIGPATMQPLCAIDGVMDKVGGVMGDAIAATSTINGSVATVATTFTDITSTLAMVKDKVNTTCDAVDALVDAVQSLSDNGYPVSALLAKANAAGAVCTDLVSSVPTAIDTAEEQLSTYSSLVEMAASMVSAILTSMRSVESSIVDLDGTFGNVAVSVFPSASDPPSSSPSINSLSSSMGLGLFIIPIMLIGASLLVAPLMVRSQGKYRCCSFASCGVQMLGLAWVVGALFCVFYFLIGATVMGASVISNDIAVAVQTVPAQFRSTFDGTMLCGEMAPAGTPVAFATAFNLLLNSSYVSTIPSPRSPPPALPFAVPPTSPLLPPGVCELIELALDTCWLGDGAGSTLINSILDALDFRYSLAGLEGEISGLESKLAALNLDDVGVNSTEISALIATVNSTVGELTTADLGLTCPGDAQCAAAQAALDDLKAKALLMAAEGTQLLSYFEYLAWLVDGLPALLVSTLQDALDSAVDLTECGWVKIQADLVMASVRGISSTLYVFAFVGLILCSIFMCLFMPAAISMQIAHGGVGAVPGCPPGCRGGCKDKSQIVPASNERLAGGAKPKKKGWRKSKGDGFDK